MFISHQTYEGMKISIYSLIELVKFLLNADVDFVLTSRFCQDPVEQYFGKQSEIGRRSDNPTIKTFGYNDNSIRMQRALVLLKNGGVASIIKNCLGVKNQKIINSAGIKQ
jgi:predicted Fe-Mo cluster-binding NifX family protein